MATSDFTDWAQRNWGQAPLGDKRRNRRAVQLGAALAAHPEASLPAQTGSWNDLKAAYRLLAEPDVTHEALTQPHRQSIRQQASHREGVVLFIQDTTELDYSSHEQTMGLGHIGDGRGTGFLVHSCLAVIPRATSETGGSTAPELLGLAAQTIWTRETPLPRGSESRCESRRERAKRRTESDIWAETVEKIGPLPEKTPEKTPENLQWVSVGDRGSDVFSYVQRVRTLGWHCLVRVCQDRVIERKDPKNSSERERLMNCLRSLPSLASKQIVLRGRNGIGQRQVTLQIAWQAAAICSPRLRTGAMNPEPGLSGYYIRCWEQAEESAEPNKGNEGQDTREKAGAKSPKSPEMLEWLLFTTLPVEDRHSACQVLDWYSCRWLIEEYHKCLKTGCSVERRQLRSGSALRALLGFLSLVGLRLLWLRSLSREYPDRPALGAVPRSWLELLLARQSLAQKSTNTSNGSPVSVEEMSLSQFWRSVARLGGFIGRKSDGDPGWQTLWQGWFRLQDMLWAASWANATRAETK